MEQVALGILRLSEEQFLKMLPRTYNNMLLGHRLVHREKMSLHREQIVMALLPHLEKADQKKPIAKLYPLPWEPEYKKFIKKSGNKTLDHKEAKALAVQRWEEADAKQKREALSQSESPSE